MADLTITAANVVPGTNIKKAMGTAGVNITAGQVVYKDASDSNKLKLCDADSATSAAKTPVGIALHAALAGQPLQYGYGGKLAFGAIITAGVFYIASDTAGGIRPSADANSGDQVSLLGIGVSTTEIDLYVWSPTGAVVA